MPGLLFLTWGPWVAGASAERKAGNDIGTLTEGLPEVCIWLRGNLLVPSLAATLQPSPCPGGPFPAQISKAKLLLAVTSMAAHLSALCPPLSWGLNIRALRAALGLLQGSKSALFGKRE